MWEKAKTSDCFSQPFLFTTNDLERMLEQFCKFDDSGELNIIAKCADNISRRFDSPDELLDYTNPPERKILTLNLRYSQSSKVLDYCNLELDYDYILRSHRSNISLTVAGNNEDVVQSLSNKIKELILNSKPWYWWFTKLKNLVRISVSICGALLLLFVNFRVAISSFGQTSLGWSDEVSLVYVIAIISIFSIWTIFAGNLAVKYWRSIFPRGIFVIGKEKEAEKLRDWQRKLVLGLLATAFIGALSI